MTGKVVKIRGDLAEVELSARPFPWTRRKRWRTRYFGGGTVWHHAETGRRAPQWLEILLSDADALMHYRRRADA